ncbi:MAG: aminotransferase class V-fold PLP-dependent enzyme [Planctomycetes bacterium]|nr:aminotransferase class V-fold PLP-dependent enzyme [Planctomycetota bacterium]
MDRRQFVKMLAGGSALSLAAINKLNASAYDSISALNQQFQESPDGLYWDAIRKHFLIENNITMMNNGTMGPMPEPVYNTLMKYFKVQCTNPYRCYNFFPSLKGEVRNKLARFIGADPDEVAITRNTTEGMSTAANGMDLKPGDEIIMSTLEHSAGTNPWRKQEKRYGIKIKMVEMGVPPSSVKEIIDAFAAAITPRTRAISISHTIYITGMIFPIKELCELAHKNDIIVIADSAHGLGMLNLNMHQMGVDVFVSSPYKWLGAPAGVGLLYVRKEAQPKIWAQIASGGWDGDTAQKYESLGQRADPLAFALGEALNFQSTIGKGRIERRIKTLATRLKNALHDTPKVRLHTPDDPYLSAGLTAFSIEGVQPSAIVNHLREKYNIVIRTVGGGEKTRGVRVSTHYYISDNQLKMLIRGIREIAQ